MTVNSIVYHLSERGFVTRKQWSGAMVLFFGMDNLPWLSYRRNKVRAKESQRLEIWTPCLADMKADDWIRLPYFWDGSKDDFLPFKKKDDFLNRLYRDRKIADSEVRRKNQGERRRKNNV